MLAVRLASGKEENFYLQVFGALTPCFKDVLLSDTAADDPHTSYDSGTWTRSRQT